MPRFSILRMDRIAVQIAVVMVAALMVVHAVTAAVFYVMRDSRDARGDHPDQVAAFARLLDATADDRRAAVIGDFAKAFPRIGLRRVPAEETAAIEWDGSNVPAPPPLRGTGLRRGKLMDSSLPAPGFLMAFRLTDGAVIAANLPPPPPMPFFGPFTQSVALIALCAILLAWWASSSLTRPLRAFEEAAQQFSLNMEAQALSERGPREIRTVAHALNRMQARIKTLINDRTRVLAALSHDLRTPLTRLRLRAEFIPDNNLQQATLADIAQMQAMVDSALIYLRDGAKRPAFTRVDVATILQGACGDFGDMGKDVTYEGPDHAIVLGDFESLQRAFANLIDNAVRYGHRARVRLTEGGDRVAIAIADAGPGIAESLKEDVFEPFVRGDAARGMDATSGFGLGLPIAKAVIASHGGRLELVNGEEGGLIVRVDLPRPAKADSSAA